MIEGLGAGDVSFSVVLEGAGGIENNCLDESSKMRMSGNIDQSLETVDAEDMAAALDKAVDKSTPGRFFQLLAGCSKSNEILWAHKSDHILQDFERDIQNAYMMSASFR